MKNQLSRTPDVEEIRASVFSLKKDNSPSPDGFSGHFFPASWQIIGPSMVRAMHQFFILGKLYRASNAYFITLIPKTQAPSSFSNYKPISLLSFTYKIIAKTLASRLAKILHHLISPNQAAFVQGRSIHQHIALAHELFQKLNSSLRGGSLCMQLDISKDFDKLSWPFLFKSLHFFGFSATWINLVRECVFPVTSLALINRTPFGLFNSNCGLRQGDPLSLYLFILVEEVLGLNIQNLVNNSIISPLSKVPSTPNHLLHANDILLFLKGQKRSLTALKEILTTYQTSSRQFINLDKSKLYIGKCSVRSKRQILAIT